MLEREDMHNERFTTYYQAQKIIPDDEWETFMEALRRPLPTTFRIAGSRQYGLLPSTDECPVLIVIEGWPRPLEIRSGIPTSPCCTTSPSKTRLSPLPLKSHGQLQSRTSRAYTHEIYRYPDGLAWQFNVSKKVLRRSPEFKMFHSFLVHETEVVGFSIDYLAKQLMHRPGKYIPARGCEYVAATPPRRPASSQGQCMVDSRCRLTNLLTIRRSSIRARHRDLR